MIETPFSDEDFRIEWSDVSSISSVRRFTIFLSSRERLYASMLASDTPGRVVLLHDGQRLQFALNELVLIEPIKDSFADRFNASVSAGVTMAKANNSRQLSVRAQLSYYTRNWKISGLYSDTRSEQESIAPIKRTEAAWT